MYLAITITAVANRDPSCNLFTLTQTHDFDYHNQPSVKMLNELLNEHKQKFLEAWPHNRQAAPILVPLDVAINVREGRRP